MVAPRSAASVQPRRDQQRTRARARRHCRSSRLVLLMLLRRQPEQQRHRQWTRSRASRVTWAPQCALTCRSAPPPHCAARAREKRRTQIANGALAAGPLAAAHRSPPRPRRASIRAVSASDSTVTGEPDDDAARGSSPMFCGPLRAASLGGQHRRRAACQHRTRQHTATHTPVPAPAPAPPAVSPRARRRSRARTNPKLARLRQSQGTLVVKPGRRVAAAAAAGAMRTLRHHLEAHRDH